MLDETLSCIVSLSKIFKIVIIENEVTIEFQKKQSSRVKVTVRFWKNSSSCVKVTEQFLQKPSLCVEVTIRFPEHFVKHPPCVEVTVRFSKNPSSCFKVTVRFLYRSPSCVEVTIRFLKEPFILHSSHCTISEEIFLLRKSRYTISLKKKHSSCAEITVYVFNRKPSFCVGVAADDSGGTDPGGNLDVVPLIFLIPALIPDLLRWSHYTIFQGTLHLAFKSLYDFWRNLPPA